MNASMDNIRDGVEAELTAANEKHELFHSFHEAYGVILEEFSEATEEIKNCKDSLIEFFDDIRNNDDASALDDLNNIKVFAQYAAAEACQVAAMAEKAIQSYAEYKRKKSDG